MYLRVMFKKLKSTIKLTGDTKHHSGAWASTGNSLQSSNTWVRGTVAWLAFAFCCANRYMGSQIGHAPWASVSMYTSFADRWRLSRMKSIAAWANGLGHRCHRTSCFWPGAQCFIHERHASWSLCNHPRAVIRLAFGAWRIGAQMANPGVASAMEFVV